MELRLEALFRLMLEVGCCPYICLSLQISWIQCSGNVLTCLARGRIEILSTYGFLSRLNGFLKQNNWHVCLWLVLANENSLIQQHWHEQTVLVSVDLDIVWIYRIQKWLISKHMNVNALYCLLCLVYLHCTWTKLTELCCLTWFALMLYDYGTLSYFRISYCILESFLFLSIRLSTCSHIHNCALFYKSIPTQQWLEA